MGLLTPALPDLDHERWRRLPRMQRLRPIVLDWASSGSGTPEAILLAYAVKILAYIGVAVLIGCTATGSGSLSSWWAQPWFFPKVAVWTLLFEVLGLGCGFGPLTMRFIPPIGGPLYWLRPRTIRLPPWPDRIPGTRGTGRTALDIALYAGVVAAAVFALLSPGDRPAGMLAAWRLAPMLV
jgi:hypothetical protein